MKYSLLTIFLILYLSIFANAQNSHIVRVDFLSLGITTEHKIRNNSTIATNISLAPSVAFFSSGSEMSSYLSFNPTLFARYNYFLNFDKRNARGANTDYNSGNYLFVGLNWGINAGLTIISPNLNKGNVGNSYFSIPFGFGIQRSFAKRFYYNGFIGGNYSFETDNLYHWMGFKIGYTLFNKK